MIWKCSPPQWIISEDRAGCQQSPTRFCAKRDPVFTGSLLILYYIIIEGSLCSFPEVGLFIPTAGKALQNVRKARFSLKGTQPALVFPYIAAPWLRKTSGPHVKTNATADYASWWVGDGLETSSRQAESIETEPTYKRKQAPLHFLILSGFGLPGPVFGWFGAKEAEEPDFSHGQQRPIAPQYEAHIRIQMLHRVQTAARQQKRPRPRYQH